MVTEGQQRLVTGSITILWSLSAKWASKLQWGDFTCIENSLQWLAWNKALKDAVFLENVRIFLSVNSKPYILFHCFQWQFTLKQFPLTSRANGKCCEIIAANMLLYLWNAMLLRRFQWVDALYYQLLSSHHWAAFLLGITSLWRRNTSTRRPIWFNRHWFNASQPLEDFNGPFKHGATAHSCTLIIPEGVGTLAEHITG